jgi:hypothetical protein
LNSCRYKYCYHYCAIQAKELAAGSSLFDAKHVIAALRKRANPDETVPDKDFPWRKFGAMVAVSMRTVPRMCFMHGPLHRDEKVHILFEITENGLLN